MSTHSLQAQQLLAALAVPTTALVQKRIPKKMLAESGAATVADRKLVQDHIEELTWYAALKPGMAACGDIPGRARIQRVVVAPKFSKQAVRLAAR